MQNVAQKADMEQIFHGVKGAGVLDYVAAWYLKAAQYMNPLPSPASGRGGKGEGSYVPHPPQKLPANLKSYARELCKEQTDAEQLVWHLLRGRQIQNAKFRRQHPLGRYILDFYCDEYKLAIELDGGQHAEQINYDETRTAFLTAQGIRVLRFWNNQVLQETESVMEAIWLALQPAPDKVPHPSSPTLPPPAGEGGRTKTAFVSTNSIVQGEQVGILWGELLNKYHIKIQFAHRTFKWGNDARGKAAVHCVIIGFDSPRPQAGEGAGVRASDKRIWDYEKPDSDAHEIKARNINAYLVDAPDVIIPNRNLPTSLAPEMNYGSFALDDGNYTLSETDREQILAESPDAGKYVRPFIGGQEMLHSIKRWCLWLEDAQPSELRSLSAILRRVEAVKKWREESNRETTKKLAATSTRFAEIRQPSTNYIAIPTVSSEQRAYIPMAFLSPETIASNQLYILPHATLYHFGILTSTMHMAWVRYTCGRLESRYRYSAGIVYNNFPWPDLPSSPALPPAGEGSKQRAAVEAAAQAVLDARAQFPQSSLADLYDPLTMPPVLVKAHQKLDAAVDACYRKAPFANDAQRVEFLFERYQQLTSLLPVEKKATKRKLKS